MWTSQKNDKPHLGFNCDILLVEICLICTLIHNLASEGEI